MLGLPGQLWEYYIEEEYQKLAHICLDLQQEGVLDEETKPYVISLEKYALACDEWEKTYNFPSIISKLEDAEQEFQKISEKSPGLKSELALGLAGMCRINIYAVGIENAMLFNDESTMVENSILGVQTLDDVLSAINFGQNDIMDSVIELIESYRMYVDCWGKYATVYQTHRSGEDYQAIYTTTLQYLEDCVETMIEDDDRITSSEIQGLVANLKSVKNYWDIKEPSINITSSYHHLSTSFYTGNKFSDYIIETYGLKPNKVISEEIFGGEVAVASAGIDGLEDFLQTSIGERYGDVFHVILDGGTLELKGETHDFDVHLYLRRFGTGTIVIELEPEGQRISDFRMFQTLIGPQAGVTRITWQDESFQKLDQINRKLYRLLEKFHTSWLASNDILEVLQMSSATYDSDRTWFARSVIREAYLEYHDKKKKKISDWKELQESFEFKALTSELLEGRPSLDDWIQIPLKQIINLAEIRLHQDDLVLFDTHTLLVFLPSKPDFILQGILSTGMLVNDISTLINGFDVMAEHVRSNLIDQVHKAKIMLEQVEIDKIKADLKILRRNVIEITEFELLALQSIQLLKSQSTIKYPDHAKFMIELIDRSSISATISSLEQKIGIIKESQEGILRTADDLVAKYQEEVSESQQRLVRVITLIGAGVSQITIIDDILSVFTDQGWINSGNADTVKLVVIILAFILSGIAISWLGLGYLKTKSNLFDDNNS